MYYFVEPSDKKRLCLNKHYWVLKFEQGTKQPHVVCLNCKHSEKVYWIDGHQKFEILKEHVD